MLLYTFTMAVNYIALIIAWWFGLYVVTRNPRRLISWLTGLTFWTMSGLFLNILLALSPPPPPHNFPKLLQYFFLVWPMGTFEGGSGSWLQGWSITLSIMLWHHVTVIMRPGKINTWRTIRIIVAYGIATTVIAIQVLQTHLLYISTSGDPLYLSTLRPGALYPIIAASILLFTGMSIYNLLRSVKAAPTPIQRGQFMTLGIATLIAGLSAPISIVGSMLNLPVPMVLISILYIITITMMGYGVARYSALSEGRTMRRDLTYNAVAMTITITLYVLVTWASVSFYNAPVAAFIPMILLAITTHMLVDTARQTLDTFFHRRDNRVLRANFRRLAGDIGEQDSREILSLALASMSSSVRAIYSLLLLFEENQVKVTASHNWTKKLPELSMADLSADDVLPFEPGHFPDSLHDVTLLIPLYAEATQLGAVVLGRPVNGLAYSQADIELLLYPSDKLAEAVRDMHRQNLYLDQLAKVSKNRKAKLKEETEHISVKNVENALRNLTDYAFLGDTKLATLNLTQKRLLPNETTHLDRGKAVYGLVIEALEKLRPAETEPPTYPVPREWHAYLVLYDAYVMDKSNRDIMSKLYISEGTFNRTRRSAIRAIARALIEMEAQLR